MRSFHATEEDGDCFSLGLSKEEVDVWQYYIIYVFYACKLPLLIFFNMYALVGRQLKPLFARIASINSTSAMLAGI